jgi:hypothetical protein
MSAECQEDKTVLALPELNVGSITSKIYCKWRFRWDVPTVSSRDAFKYLPTTWKILQKKDLWTPAKTENCDICIYVYQFYFTF